MSACVLGIIAGSGIYNIAMEDAHWQAIDSPWGTPSDDLRIGYMNGLKVVFLPRHGRGHVHSPSDINYRANIDCMKRAGVTDLISLSACGSFREELAPGHFVIVDQFIDRTSQRPQSFFGSGCVAHVSLAHPVAPRLGDHIEQAARDENIVIHRGGTYLALEGPQFATLAESQMHRDMKCDVVGMTNMPEARLAREAELSYATVAMVTDYDSWHLEFGPVDINDIFKVMTKNSEQALKLVSRLSQILPREHEACPIGSDRALQYALVTAHERRDPDLMIKLAAIVERVLCESQDD